MRLVLATDDECPLIKKQRRCALIAHGFLVVALNLVDDKFLDARVFGQLEVQFQPAIHGVVILLATLSASERAFTLEAIHQTCHLREEIRCLHIVVTTVGIVTAVATILEESMVG